MLEDFVSLSDDPLSHALTKMKLRASVSVALDAGGSWAIDFPGAEGLTLNVVHKGEPWIALHGSTEPIRLQPGDCFLLPGRHPFRMSRDRAPKKIELAKDLFYAARGNVLTSHGGGDAYIAGTVFRFEGRISQIMLERLPPLIHIRGDSEQAAVLRWSLDRFGVELRSQEPGRSLMLNHLAPIMLLQTLRIYLATAKNDDNWLVALSNPRLGKVLSAMHVRYDRDWSLGSLADVAGMSRSAFALAFKKTVGLSPMDYLMTWRMQTACELLDEGAESIAAVASAVGYHSESAFSSAFQKALSCRPGAYRSRER